MRQRQHSRTFIHREKGRRKPRLVEGNNVVAEIVIEVEERPRMARVKHSGQFRPDREGVDEQSAELLTRMYVSIGERMRRQ